MILTILLDGFSFKYFSFNTKFLSKLRMKSCWGHLKPPFGFEPDYAYIAGLDPDEANKGMQYWLDEETSVFNWLHPWNDYFSTEYKIHTVLRKMVRIINFLKEKNSGKKYFSNPAQIPFNKLHYFDVVCDKLMFEEGYVKSETIFDILEKSNSSWRYWGYPLFIGDIDRFSKKLHNIKLKDLDFLFIFISDLDKIGHKYGPNSLEIKKTIKKIDKFIENIFQKVTENNVEFDCFIFGDHGMSEVVDFINVDKILDKLEIKKWIDYFYFIDSTFLRFWPKNNDIKNYLIENLKNVNKLNFLNDELKKKYNAEYKHNKFGELIYYVNEGVLLLPNFFQGDVIVKGMHGYPNIKMENYSAYLHYSTDFNKEINVDIEMKEIFKIIKNRIENSNKLRLM